MLDDERVQYLQGRLDYRAAQVGGLEASITSTVRHLEFAIQHSNWALVQTVVNVLKGALSDAEATAAKYADNAAKLDKPQNEKPI